MDGHFLLVVKRVETGSIVQVVRSYTTKARAEQDKELLEQISVDDGLHQHEVQALDHIPA